MAGGRGLAIGDAAGSAMVPETECAAQSGQVQSQHSCNNMGQSITSAKIYIIST